MLVVLLFGFIVGAQISETNKYHYCKELKKKNYKAIEFCSKHITTIE